MTQEQRDDRSGLPGVSDIPVLGGLFRQKTGSLTKRELVILIKPSVIGADGAWPEADAALSAVKQ
jgi:MSHA biogenesis protein MshL